MSVCPHCRCGAGEPRRAAAPRFNDQISPAQEPADVVMPSDSEWVTACHEAAHVVLAILAGGYIGRATIVPAEGYQGIVYSRQPLDPTLLETRIVNSLAGIATGAIANKGINPTATAVQIVNDPSLEEILDGIRKHEPAQTCGNDDCEALRLIIKRRPTATAKSVIMDFIRAQGAVIALLSDSRIWRAIGEIANLLMVRKTCHDDELRPIVLRHVPDARLLDLISRHRLIGRY